jgi:hypothetical protein
MPEIKDVNELISELSAETENDQREASQQQAQPKPEFDKTDFDLTQEPTDKPESQINNTITPDKAKSTAQTWIKWFNSLMKMGFPYLYKKSVLKKGDQEKMAEFVRTHAGQSEKQMEEAISSDDNLWPVKNRFDKYIKACDEIPLSQEEIEYIAEPLSELIIKYKFMQLSPEWSLVIAVLIVMLPRFEPLMPGIGKIISTATDKS